MADFENLQAQFPAVPDEFKRVTYQTAKALAMAEVPLVIADEPTLWQFLQWLPTMLDGSVVYASATDATAQTLDNVGRAEYLVLVLDDEMPEDLNALVRYYLVKRDILGDGDAILERRFGPDCIQADHRLVLVCDPATAKRLDGWTRERVTPVAVLDLP